MLSQHAQVGKQVEGLENHAHLGAHGVDVLGGVQRDAVHDDFSAFKDFQPVDAAQQGRFPGPRWTDDDDHLAFLDVQANAFQGMDLAKKLVNVLDLNNGFHGDLRYLSNRVFRSIQ